MTRIRVPLPRRISTLAASSLLITATLATTACGQSQGAAPAAAGRVNVDSLLERADRGRMKGADSAQVTIIEISDFQCPYCREFAAGTYKQIDSAYVRTGRARMLYINLPLSTHREAFGAAEAAMCAGAQGKFWQMHDRLFATQREWSSQPDAAQRFERLAGELQLDMAAFRDCTVNDRTASIIVADAMQAAEARINGTPTFILNARGGQRSLTGAVPFDQFAREIDALLSAPAPAGATPPGSTPPAQTPPAPAQPAPAQP
jgi:protein-disulfide isomerase